MQKKMSLLDWVIGRVTVQGSWLSLFIDQGLGQYF
jgi:hypothetical protein